MITLSLIIIMAVENDPFSWKETNIGDTPIFIHFPLIMGAEEGYFFIFITTRGNDPIWLIFFKGIETTN